MLFGAHVSVADGYLAALDYAQSVGCECMQIFAKSPRQWRGPPIDSKAAAKFLEARAVRGFGPLFTHTAYLINLAAFDPEMREKSVTALADEIVRAATLGATAVVTHLGSDPIGDVEAATLRVSSAILSALELAGESATRTCLLLENSAGAGNSCGATLEELTSCITASGLPAERLGLCIDTCHAFARGWPVDSASGWDAIVSDVVSWCGLERLRLIHANDCLSERGSRLDRHAWLGKGTIGMDGFRAMVTHPRLQAIPACTEMPGECPQKDAVNIEVLKALRESL